MALPGSVNGTDLRRLGLNASRVAAHASNDAVIRASGNPPTPACLPTRLSTRRTEWLDFLLGRSSLDQLGSRKSERGSL